MDALYQEKILNWAKKNRAITPLSGDFLSATLSNPACGDRVEVRLHVDDEYRITNVSATVRGCALCEAGAGLFASLAPDKMLITLPELQIIFTRWLGANDGTEIVPELQDFTPVRQIKNRHKCVLLAFDAGTKILTHDSVVDEG